MGNSNSGPQLGGGESSRQATLQALPSKISDDAIAMMGLDEFLVRYGGVTPEIAETFSKMYSPGTSQQDMVVDLSFYLELMPSINKSNVMKVLRASYVRGVDYIERDMPTISKQWGGQGKKQIVMTPDCFKRLCMRSKAANAETVRTYFLRMETLTRRYFGAKASKSDSNVKILLGNQQKAPSTDELDDTQGFIYIFPVTGRIRNLFRVGSSINLNRRMREHGSSHGDSLVNSAVFVKVYDVRTVEQAVNLFLKHRKYRGSKEVYIGNFDMIKDMVLQCGMAAAVGIAAERGKPIADFAPIIIPRQSVEGLMAKILGGTKGPNIGLGLDKRGHHEVQGTTPRAPRGTAASKGRV